MDPINISHLYPIKMLALIYQHHGSVMGYITSTFLVHLLHSYGIEGPFVDDR